MAINPGWRVNNTLDITSIPVKKSYGIILCKINNLNNKPEVLLVHKRYTYAYSMFVHGKYVKPNIWPRSSMYFIINLLSQMTLEELLDIWSLDFKQIWYRIWLNTNCDTELYKRKYTKFYTSFIKTDNGTYLRNLLQQVRNYNYLNWEVPKGRPKNMQETNLDCAIREMKEETGLNKPDYFIIPNVRRYVNYISLGTRYICTYYIALINPNIKYFNHNIFKNMSNFTEISETKWFDIDKIRTVDDHKHHLESLVKPAFVLIKKYIAGKWLTRYRKLKLD